MINFNVPTVTGNELKYISQALKQCKISGDGMFTKTCSKWFEEKLPCNKALLTTSGTAALEMAAMLADIKYGDEVILPSYTFVSTANAFALRGAKLVFIDIRPDTMNMNEELIERAITERTRVIVPVHYAGVSCEMDIIMNIARKYKLLVIEDAAQSVGSLYKGKYLGTIGHLGCYSFHETKNYTCGEGGALIINEPSFIDRAEIIREKGTNRSKFFRGQIDKYTWVDMGSSYLPSELNAAYLLAQLENKDIILNDRMSSWNFYYRELIMLAEDGKINIPVIPDKCQHNGHMFYIKVRNLEERTDIIEYLKEHGIFAVFHYIPLHSSIAGKNFGRFSGEDKYTTSESEKLLRLPLYYGMRIQDLDYVVKIVKSYFLR